MVRGPTANPHPPHQKLAPNVMRPSPKKPAVAGPWTSIQNPKVSEVASSLVVAQYNERFIFQS